MRGFAIIAAVLTLAGTLILPGCAKTQHYRYKQTLTVETPDGVRSAFNVVEIEFYHGTQVRGEALYLDLGPGKRPLIALLTYTHITKPPSDWSYEHPTKLLGRLYGEKYQSGDPSGDQWRARIFAHRGAKEIAPPDLPDLVTFADVNNPKSVMAVDANDLEATLGPGVKWKSIALEVTDEPLTSGIEKRLGWLTGLKNDRTHGDLLLDGQPYGHSGGDLANSLSWTNFIREGF
jgi:hypothetical protein